eukprot:CAMPEP_0202002938 /NCGR_PEP_ID=MMETSP0905-20130828/8664_1 /ASSEMBLY_ACC=CAM_ASM_000554 /TAXON_ID=420261 /ORGANISM="Thalassiosira antarctica, Strain CCMP982" /LENGTH=322 /DNA_ID=CAMNT_0048559989 /DNA_START=83 /DNA_END=1051 /DNA_ORIENTATION=-
MVCGDRRSRVRTLPYKAILVVSAVLVFLGTDVCESLSIQHHRGMAPRWQAQRLQRQDYCRSDRGVGSIIPTSTSYKTSSCITRLASSTSSHLDTRQNQLHVSVTVDTTVSVSSMYYDGTTTLSSASSATPSTTSPTKSSDEDDAVSMDTPARQSLPSHLCLLPMPGKGVGVVCLKPISKGEVVGEYKGEVMLEDVKDRRYLSSLKDQQTDEDRQWIQSRLDRGQTLTGCYLYGISIPPNYYDDDQTTATRIYVDAEDEYESLWTRFFNHASPPYNNVNPKSIHESYDGNPRVWFIANRDIEEGEEICFDYGDDYWLEGDDVV